MLKFIQKLLNRRNRGVLAAETQPLESDNGLRARYPLTITIHNAHGGIILSVRRYNKKTDEYDNVNYIVHEEDEIASTVEKILFIENLKQ